MSLLQWWGLHKRSVSHSQQRESVQDPALPPCWSGQIGWSLSAVEMLQGDTAQGPGEEARKRTHTHSPIWFKAFQRTLCNLFSTQSCAQVADEKSCMQFSIRRPTLPSTEIHPEERLYRRLDVSSWLRHLNHNGQVEEEYKLRKVRLIVV